jgi:predicted Kef-type K+ transport protein
MKKNIRFLNHEPSLIQVISLILLSIVLGTFTSEIVSRPINGYLIVASIIFTMGFIAGTMGVCITWIINYIQNKTNK